MWFLCGQDGGKEAESGTCKDRANQLGWRMTVPMEHQILTFQTTTSQKLRISVLILNGRNKEGDNVVRGLLALPGTVTTQRGRSRPWITFPASTLSDSLLKALPLWKGAIQHHFLCPVQSQEDLHTVGPPASVVQRIFLRWKHPVFLGSSLRQKVSSSTQLQEVPETARIE